MPYLELEDETELYFNDWGAGTPVVLIHGWPLSSDMWEHQAAFLVAAGYRVITYDRRGFGKSSRPYEGHDYDSLAADLAQLIDELDLVDAVLVGFSMGGGEVVRYLSNYSSVRISKAVLISSVTPYMLKTDSNPDGTPESTFDGFRASILKDRFDFLTTFGPQFYGRSAIHHTVSDSVLAWTFALGAMASPEATLDDLMAFSTTDFRAEMATLNTPFLIIHGTGDKTVPIDAAGRAAAKILPRATLIEYEGEPHGLFMTAPDRLNKDLLNFIGGDQNLVPKLEQI
jgi:pimeloyl-ACP methyl ester carboxylesterase